MNASLIVIGTELTRGIIQDKHGILVSRELTHLGIHISEIVAIPDDGTIKSVLGALMRNNDILIITGGLGPTSDDMTRQVIADAAGVELKRDEECWRRLYQRLGDRAYGANEKQAMIPDGFTFIANANGTAPGFYGTAGEVLIISLPGPPREMEPMFYESVIPLLYSHLGKKEEERDEYSSFITAEAKLEELCEEADSSLSWGTRFQDYKISLYVSGGDKAERERAIDKIRESVGRTRLVKGDETALSLLVKTLKAQHVTISAAESCTGGLAASLLTSLPGSSEYMMGSVTSYSPLVKEHALGVKKETIERYGCVSRECAREMADGARGVCLSDYALSITGVAGPDKAEGKPVGTLCFGFSGKGKESKSVSVMINSYGRESVRRRASVIAFLLMRAYIEDEDLERIVESWKVF